MHASKQDRSSLDARVSLLEKRLRMYQMIGMILFAFLAVAVGTGFVQVPGAIRATAFEMIDNQGNTVAALGPDSAGHPGIFFFNVQGVRGPVEVLGSNGRNIFIPAKAGNGNIMLETTQAVKTRRN